jgi:hypothetical protein
MTAGKISKPLRRFTLEDRRMNWEFPQHAVVELCGRTLRLPTTVIGVTSGIQGGVAVEFRKR